MLCVAWNNALRCANSIVFIRMDMQPCMAMISVSLAVIDSRMKVYHALRWQQTVVNAILDVVRDVSLGCQWGDANEG
jgi:hypothetical protein